jgi:hypothetical protein
MILEEELKRVIEEVFRMGQRSIQLGIGNKDKEIIVKKTIDYILDKNNKRR